MIRFEAELPNETWQADMTHWRLAGQGHVEILNMIDDHSRLFLASRAYPTVKAADVVEVFRGAVALHGAPASLLCDNGAVFTATSRGGKVLMQIELERLGIAYKNSRPYHPQTCGKVERFHQTSRGTWQTRLRRGHSPSCKASSTPSRATTTRPALTGRSAAHAPAGPQRQDQGPAGRWGRPDTHFRVRHDKVDTAGTVTLRHDSKLHHIGIGRAHKGKPVKLLIADRDVRVLDATR